ncbi:MAG: glycosyltransferase family 9 protein [Burkholderiaceae bacterium]|nr:glycosyltransferase family 9 protein [Burkholderiaceae bacterium]
MSRARWRERIPPAGSWLHAARAAGGADRVGLTGLYLFCLGYVGSKPLANVGLAVLVAAFVAAVARDPARWRGDPLLRLGIAWVFYVGALMAWRSYGGMPGSLLGAENLCLALIPAVAWATGGRAPRILAALLLALLGLLVRLAFDLRWGQGPWFDYASTPDMMGVNRNISSLMLNTAIIGALLWLLAGLRGRSRTGHRDTGRWSAIVGGLALLVVLLAPWVASPSRMLWLSLVFVVVVVLARLLPHRARWVAAAIVACFAAIVAVMVNSGHFGTVLTKDMDTWRVLLSGEWSVVPESSSGLRFRMLQMGLEALAANPWTGVANSGSQILRQNPDFVLSSAAQLHNGYLEILVRTGLVGLAFFVAALALAGRAAHHADRDGRMPWPLRELLLAALLLFLLINLSIALVFFQHGWQYLVLFAGIAHGFSVAAQTGDASARPVAKRILIVRSGAIGDVVFASPLAAALRRTWPHARIAWVVEPGIDALIAHDPTLDEIIVWPKAEWLGLWRARRLRELWRRVRAFRAGLRERRFDLALDLHGLAKGALIARLSGAPRRIGLGAREGSRWLVTEVVARGGDASRIGSEYLHLARYLGLDCDDFLPRLTLDPRAEARAMGLLARHGIEARGYAVFAAFTTRPQKHWFAEAWQALAPMVQERTGLVPVLLGGPSDRAEAARIVAGAPAMIDLAGQTGLAEAAALVRHAGLLVGVDTGLTHMGIAFSVPTVALFGSTCPYTVTGRANARVIRLGLACSPCGRRPTCNGAWTCMRDIAPRRVADEASAVLGIAA